MTDDAITWTPPSVVNDNDGSAAAATKMMTSSFYDVDRNLSGWRICPEAGGNSTDADDFYNTAQMVTGLFIYPAFCFPGLIGNILTVVVLSQRNMLNSTNAFLSALAVSDSIKLINDILYFFVTLFLNTDSVLGNLSYAYLYPYAHFIFSMSVCVSSWLTVSVAVERYILVCHPTRARNIWSRKRAVALCVIVYVVMTALALPNAFRYRTIECFDRVWNATRLDVELTEMWENETFVTSYTWTQNLLRSIIPLVVLVVLNICIIRAVRRTKIKKRKNSRHRVTIMMIVVILTFLFCITPDAILSTIFGRGYHEAGKVTKGIREITDTLLTINAAVNFIIYCALNRVFRKSFTHLCCPRKSQESGWVTEMDESVYRRLSEAKASVLSNNNNPSQRQDMTSPGRSPPSPKSPTTPSERGDKFVSSDPSSPTSPGFCSERYALFNNSSKASVDSNNYTVGDFQDNNINTNRPRSLNYQTNSSSHPCRGSTHGLKKSRNSVKCSRGKRAGNEKNDLLAKEAVTYIPAEEFDSNINIGRGSRRSRTPRRTNYHRSGNEEDPYQDRSDYKNRRNPKNSPLSNNASPATTDSDVILDDRLHNDVTPTNNGDVVLTSSSPTNSSCSENSSNDNGNNDDTNTHTDRGDQFSEVEKAANVNTIIVPTSSPCEGATELTADSDKLRSNGAATKVKRTLTVSFSEC